MRQRTINLRQLLSLTFPTVITLARKDNYDHASRKEKKAMQGTKSERRPLHIALANL